VTVDPEVNLIEVVGVGVEELNFNAFIVSIALFVLEISEVKELYAVSTVDLSLEGSVSDSTLYADTAEATSLTNVTI
jgi:hypothetical protein